MITQRNNRLFFLLFILFSTSLLQAEETIFAFFTPPKEWKISAPSLFKDGVKIGFVHPKKQDFPPSITLSLEHIKDVPLKTYLKAVKKNYEKDLKIRYRELGFLTTSLGEAHLAQIEISKPWGEIRTLQTILIKDGYALIQTGVCKKEDLMDVHEDFLSTFRSLSSAENFLESLDSSPKRETLEQKIANLSEKNWLPFVNYITKTFEKEGPCWQFLALQTIKEGLLK